MKHLAHRAFSFFCGTLAKYALLFFPFSYQAYQVALDRTIAPCDELNRIIFFYRVIPFNSSNQVGILSLNNVTKWASSARLELNF